MGVHWSNDDDEVDEEDNVVLNYAHNAFQYIRQLEGDTEEYFGYQVQPDQGEHAAEPEAARLKASVHVIASSIGMVWKEGEPDRCRSHFVFDAMTPCTVDVYANDCDLAILTHKREHKSTLLVSKSYPQGFAQRFVCEESDTWVNSTEVSEGNSLFVIVIRGTRYPGYDVNAQTTCCNLLKEEKAESISITQKITHNENSYVTKDIFGLEKESMLEDCAICLCEKKDSVILPCRHLCVCRACAQVLQSTSPKCPICRTIIKAVLVGDSKLFSQPISEQEAVDGKERGEVDWDGEGGRLAERENDDNEFFPFVYNTVRSILTNPLKELEDVGEPIAVVNSSSESLKSVSDDEIH